MGASRSSCRLAHVCAVAAALAVVAVSCGDSAVDSVATTTTTTGDTTTPTSATTTTTTTTTSSTTAAAGAPIAIDPSWVPYADGFFVWGVASDDALNVRSGAGVTYPVVATLAHDASRIRRFDVTVAVGSAQWGMIAVPGGGGWVNLAFLRPMGTRPPRIEGTIDPRTETAADDVQALLGAGDYEGLAGFIDPSRGLVISVHAFVGADAPVVTAEQVAAAASDDTVLLWGYTDGEGAPISSTIADRLAAIAGDTAITSTDIIGFDVRVGMGNSFDNIAERFPGAAVVEYHFDGTSLYGDFDWSSVRFVFDTEVAAPTGRPALLAIVQDTWTI